ncbi:translation initiation factor 1a if-1 [Ophiostoma piceae UAMH 11346]|uniref:Translation initiation factor 1a if-1 n=1 Tax=Ophiostoma piceae (strain UAMH 11346) TaxID=1262450 RepID=S3C0E0_OPHP1|nr:translation initiation factor 1a if-1 [Ophiostoma piceae UAMH 11346]
MGRKNDVSRHTHQALKITSSTPPAALEPAQLIGRVVKKEGGPLCTCFMPKDMVVAAFGSQDTSDTSLNGMINAATGNVVVEADGSLKTADPDSLNYKIMAELNEYFRSATSVMRGSHIVLDLTIAPESRAANRKVFADIVMVISDFRAWHKQPYWPASFSRDALPGNGIPSVQSTKVGEMPPDDE